LAFAPDTASAPPIQDIEAGNGENAMLRVTTLVRLTVVVITMVTTPAVQAAGSNEDQIRCIMECNRIQRACMAKYPNDDARAIAECTSVRNTCLAPCLAQDH
jgi:hypothetical protein